jgi:hypothetical protein
MHRFTHQFVDYCRRELDFEKQMRYRYRSLSVCIIDCIYSLRARYYNVTMPVVERYAAHYLCNNIESPDDKISDLIAHIQNAGGPIPFSSAILNNAQRSGGVLKSEICLNLAQYLQLLHIETIDDFRNFESQELLEIVVHSVKGLGDAGTNYLFMLAGDPNRCKPDVHIHHCIRDACGEDISNDDCQILFTDTVTELGKDYPKLTVAMLDGIIWRKYQTSKQK